MAGRDRDGSVARARRRVAVTAAATSAILALGASSALASGFQATPQTIASTEASSFSGPVGQFTTDPQVMTISGVPIGASTCPDPAVPAFVYATSIDWGDGTNSSGTLTLVDNHPTVTPPATGWCTYAVTGSHTYTDDGHRSLVVHVTRNAPLDLFCVTPATPCTTYGPGGDIDSTANVADAPLSGITGGISATQGVPFAGLVAAFSDANDNAPLRDYSATISWGDGTSSPGTFAPNPDGSVSVFGNHTYAQPGSFPMSVAVHDAGGAETTPSGTANVAAAPEPATTAAPSKSKAKPKHKARCAKGRKLVGKGKKAHCVKVRSKKTKHTTRRKKH